MPETSSKTADPGSDAPDRPRRIDMAPFRAFDALHEAESRTSAPRDVQESIVRLKRLIDALPQRRAIQDHHAERWLERTMLMAQERMQLEMGPDNVTLGDIHRHVLWHVRRASGFGGSEVGTVVHHFRDERGTFTNAHNLVLEKLLVMSPQPSTPEMSRGVRAEPWIRAIYQDKTGFRTDSVELDRLRGFRWEKAPFQTGTPDDIVMQPDGKRRVVDYKAPSADVCEGYEANGISFDYVCQLHHYAVIAMAAQCRFSEMSIEVLDPRSFEIVSYPVEFDRDLAREILQSSRKLWLDHVMTGIVPDPVKIQDLTCDDPAMIVLGHEAAMFRVMREAIEKQEKDRLERLAILGSDMHDKAAGKIPLVVADFTRARTWDEEKLTGLARSAGVDLSAFRVSRDKPDADRSVEILSALVTEIRDGGDPSGLLEDLARDGVPVETSLDLNALAAHLEEIGISTGEAAGLKSTFAITRKKKGPGYEAATRLRDSIADLVEDLEVVVQDTATRIIAGDVPAEDLPHDYPEA